MTPVDVFMLLALVALIGVLLTLVWLDTPTELERRRQEADAARYVRDELERARYAAAQDAARRRHPTERGPRA